MDGYVADETGNFDWSTPDEEGFAFISDLLRPIGMYLYGRRMYETMAIWETPDVIPPDAIPGRTPRTGLGAILLALSGDPIELRRL